MLDLFLEWKALGTSEVQKLLYVINTTKRKTSMTQYLSYLAYETLFDKNKETTLTFSSSTLIQLSIPHDVIKDCLASGILKEERSVSLCESTQSSFSFFHKSMQEYLAAVYIASEFKEMLKSQKDGHDLTDVCKKCVGKYFGSCKTVVDILEQSNLLIMLCGLVPQLLTNVSEYIYNVTLVDKMMVEERHKAPESSSDHPELINDIQKCILNCFEEGLSIAKNVNSPVYIADLYIDPSKDLLRYAKNIIVKKVLSVEVDELRNNEEYEKYDKEALYHAVQLLTNCDQLKAMRFKFNFRSDKRILNEVATILETNISTFETVSLKNIDNRILTILSKMQQLTSLHVKEFITSSSPHHDVLSLCKFVNQNTSLKHITLRIDCDCNGCDEHILDLSKHKQLQHVDASFCNLYAVSCNTDNLEKCELNISSDIMMKSLCNSLYKAGKLQYLQLCYYKPTGPEKIEDTTENVIKLLPSLDSLRNLSLLWFAFTDNILARPCDMKNLKYIFLPHVTFSMTSWCKFIDSLPALPQIVTVQISGKIIRDGTISRYKVSDIKQTEYAKQYVRKKTHLFREEDCTIFFAFTTKKA